MGLAESRMRRHRRQDGGVVAGDDGDDKDEKALAAVMAQRNTGHTILLLRARIKSIMAENSKLKHLWCIQLEKDTVDENLLGQIDFSGLDVPDPIPLEEAMRMRLARETKRYGDAITQILSLREAGNRMRDEAWETTAKLERMIEYLEGFEGDGDGEVQAQWDRELGDSWWAQL
ncbi:MAG: hypothetical protein Q9212_006586 [Teloschistes hypoglaucus]